MEMVTPSYVRGEQSSESPVNARVSSIEGAGRLPWSSKEKIFVLAASALFLIISIGAIRTESLTANELLFIPAGVSYLQRHDARMDIEEPPLVKVIAAIPALFFHPKVDYNDSAWTANPGSSDPEYLFGKKFFESWNPHHRAMLFAVRLPMIGLALLLGLSLYKMARQLAGLWGATVTLVLFVTSPFFIAYGSLVHMDVPVALFTIWTMWFFASLWQEPTKRNAALFAGSLAGALVTKFSGIFLFPAIFLAWAWFRYQKRRSGVPTSGVDTGQDRFERERLALGAMLLALVAVYAFYSATFYRSDVSGILLNEAGSMAGIRYHVLPVDILARRMINHPALRPLLLAPSLYAGGLAYVLGHGSRPMYFLGRMYPHGVWYYFPVISFFKLAPGMILVVFLLVALTIATLSSDQAKRYSIGLDSSRFHVPAILVGLMVFAAIAMASSLNIGVRHFSVPIGFTVLLCSLIVPMTQSLLGSRARFAWATIGVLVFSCLVTALLSYPHYLAYFNVFRLNMPKQEIAENSNLSWGQSMEELTAFFQQRGVSAPYVGAQASAIAPSSYIAGAHVWSCDKPNKVTPEWVAVSTYQLTHQTPDCLALLRYPSWNIGNGAVMVFHVTDAVPSDKLKAR
jgi:hypothetical protein